MEGMEERPLVIYHAQCRDGWAAAWAASKSEPSVELWPAMYGSEPPDVTGRDVTLVDFCYPREVLLRMSESVEAIRVLDHHKTAKDALAGIPWATFDMERSGAGIAWDVLVGSPRPWIINYVEDRDLWRWSLPNSREVNAFIGTLPYGKPEDLAAWNLAAKMTLTEAFVAGCHVQQAVLRYAENVCDNARGRQVGGWMVPSVNAPQHDISEVLECLLDRHEGCTFVHGWWQRADGLFANSLRSRGTFDVSLVAAMFGGGGHRNAAGFQTPKMLD